MNLFDGVCPPERPNALDQCARQPLVQLSLRGKGSLKQCEMKLLKEILALVRIAGPFCDPNMNLFVAPYFGIQRIQILVT